MHLVQPAVLGPPLARLLDLVPRQPIGRARVRVGRRPVRAGGRHRGGCWSWVADRPGSRRRGSPPSAATRSRLLERARRPRRPVPAGRAPAVARPDHGPARLVRSPRSTRSGWTSGSAWRQGAARSPPRPPTRSSWPPARGRRGPGSSGPCRWWTGSPGWTRSDVFAIHDVLDGAAVPGHRVLVLDDLDDWRGLGTALHLAEQRPRGDDPDRGRRSSPAASSTAPRTAPCARRFALAGGRTITSACVLGWQRRRARPSVPCSTAS